MHAEWNGKRSERSERSLEWNGGILPNQIISPLHIVLRFFFTYFNEKRELSYTRSELNYIEKKFNACRMEWNGGMHLNLCF